jgi:polyferredoxin
LSFWTALTFVLCISVMRRPFWSNFQRARLPAAAYITTLALTMSTYLAAGVLREHVCTFICPYGRFQSAMYEPETLTVHYDRDGARGTSGRMAARSGLRTQSERVLRWGMATASIAACAFRSVQSGIDIRDGLQYKCISCGLCVDACNTIMDKMGNGPAVWFATTPRPIWPSPARAGQAALEESERCWAMALSLVLMGPIWSMT